MQQVTKSSLAGWTQALPRPTGKSLASLFSWLETRGEELNILDTDNLQTITMPTHQALSILEFPSRDNSFHCVISRILSDMPCFVTP